MVQMAFTEGSGQKGTVMMAMMDVSGGEWRVPVATVVRLGTTLPGDPEAK